MWRWHVWRLQRWLKKRSNRRMHFAYYTSQNRPDLRAERMPSAKLNKGK